MMMMMMREKKKVERAKDSWNVDIESLLCFSMAHAHSILINLSFHFLLNYRLDHLYHLVYHLLLSDCFHFSSLFLSFLLYRIFLYRSNHKRNLVDQILLEKKNKWKKVYFFLPLTWFSLNNNKPLFSCYTKQLIIIKRKNCWSGLMSL